MAWVGAAIGAVGLGVSIFGTSKAAKAAKKAARAQRRINRANVAGLNALAISDARQARVALRNFQWEASVFQGYQLAAIRGSGLNADFGSAVAVRAQDAEQIRKDALTIEGNARDRTRETLHEIRIATLGGQSAVARIKNQGLSALYQGIGSAVQQAGNVFDSAHSAWTE